MLAGRPWTVSAGGLVVAVRLTPKGGRDTINGVERRADGQCVLKVRVRAAAIEGQANAALVVFLSRTVGVPQRDIELVSGATSRIKRVTIAGHGPNLAAILEKIVASG